jgi:hypothetical protein
VSTRATRTTCETLAGDVVVSADPIIVQSIVVANGAKGGVVVEFEDSEGTLFLSVMCNWWWTQTVNGPFLANKGMTIRALDAGVVVTVYHSAQWV